MQANELVDQVLQIESDQGRLTGLSPERLKALRAACHIETDKQLSAAEQLLQTQPTQETVLALYDAERSRDVQQISASIDRSGAVLVALGITPVEFTPAMWDAVGSCAIGGHFGKLDLLANYYASHWGDPAHGTHAIDAVLNARRGAAAGSGSAATIRSVTAPAATRGGQSNAAAAAGMYLGLFSILLSFIGIIPILAVVFSAIGLAKAGDREGKGRGQAWTGLVLGILYTFVYLYQYGHLG